MSQSHIEEHIDLIAKHEQDFLVRRTPSERLGDTIAGFAGSLGFVCIHLAIFAGWMVFNAASFSRPHHFDPPPFPLLGTLVALETILLASIILMRQSRMSRRAEERDHLMLQGPPPDRKRDHRRTRHGPQDRRTSRSGARRQR